MLVKDLMIKDVITCSPDDSISDALGKMQKYNFDQLPVTYGKELRGIITISKIIAKEVDPTTTNVSAFMTTAQKLNPSDDVNDAIEAIVNSSLKAMPVFDTELRGILSESDLLTTVKVDGVVNDIKKPCILLNRDDDVGKIKDIIINKNITVVPVVDGYNKVIGKIEALDFIKIIKKMKYEAHDRRSRHKDEKRVSFDKTSAGIIMSQAVIITPDKKINDAITLFRNNDSLIVADGKITIIKPKDILRLTVKPKRMEYIQITGLQDESQSQIDKIYQAAGELINSMSGLELQPMKISVEYISLKGRKKYSVHVQLPTNIGMFVSTKTCGFDLVSVAQDAMNNLSREISKKYEKMKEHKRSKEVLKKRP
ncbi:MAG: CBS domain-containing protein [Candidatus Aenigmatarchaeota archaeon]